MLFIEEDVRSLHQNQFRDSQAEGNKTQQTSLTEKHLCQGRAERGAANATQPHSRADTQTAVSPKGKAGSPLPFTLCHREDCTHPFLF